MKTIRYMTAGLLHFFLQAYSSLKVKAAMTPRKGYANEAGRYAISQKSISLRRAARLISAFTFLVLIGLACTISGDEIISVPFELFGNPRQNPPLCSEQYVDVEIQAARTIYSPGDPPIELVAETGFENFANCEGGPKPEDGIQFTWRVYEEDEILSEENAYEAAPTETTTYIVEVKLGGNQTVRGSDLETIYVGETALENGGDDLGELEEPEGEDLQVGEPLTVSLTADPQILSLGDITYVQAQASGGQPPYTYTWSHDSSQSFSFFYDAPGQTTIYEIEVTDAGGDQAVASETVFVEVSLPEFTFVTNFCGPDPNGLTLSFESDQPLLQFIDRFTGLRVFSGSDAIAFECLPDVNDPTRLYCVGPGSAGGGLRTIELMDNITGEPTFTTDQTLTQCPPPPTSTPEGGGGGDCEYDEDSHQFVCP